MSPLISDSVMDSADLQKVSFVEGNLSQADLDSALLTGADLSLCLMTSTKITNVKAGNVMFNDSKFGNTDLSHSLLATCRFSKVSFKVSSFFSFCLFRAVFTISF
jgi:uncharacterized protein YjbI with pentapeptide repeats